MTDDYSNQPPVRLRRPNKSTERKENGYWMLFGGALSALVFATSILLEQGIEDSITLHTGILLFVYGLTFFTTLYYGLNTVLIGTSHGQRFVKHFELSRGDAFDISNKIISAIQAIFCCGTGLTCVLYSCRRNMMTTSHFISEAYGWFGAAYFLYDIWSMYTIHSLKTQNMGLTNYLTSHAVIVGHHVFIGAFGFLVITWLRGGLGDCFFGFIYLMEASTPFVSCRQILSKCHLKSTRIYVANGIIMLVMFFLFRIVMFPAVIYLYANAVELAYVDAIASLPRGCKISILILFVPQLYWFALMMVGATKLLLPSQKCQIGGNGSTNERAQKGLSHRKHRNDNNSSVTKRHAFNANNRNMGSGGGGGGGGGGGDAPMK